MRKGNEQRNQHTHWCAAFDIDDSNASTTRVWARCRDVAQIWRHWCGKQVVRAGMAARYGGEVLHFAAGNPGGRRPTSG